MRTQRLVLACFVQVLGGLVLCVLCLCVALAYVCGHSQVVVWSRTGVASFYLPKSENVLTPDPVIVLSRPKHCSTSVTATC